MRLSAVTIGDLHVVAPRPAVPDTSIRLASGDPELGGVWERIQLPYDRVALRTVYGLFLSCRPADTVPQLTLSSELGVHEAFEEILWPTGEMSLRTSERTFVSAGAQGEHVRAHSEQPTTSTRLRYTDVRDDVRSRAWQAKEGVPQVADMPRQFAQPEGAEATHEHE